MNKLRGYIRFFALFLVVFCSMPLAVAQAADDATCVSLTGGEYPFSDDGAATDVTQCWKNCETACVKPSGCPAHFLGTNCTYNTAAMISGKQYYNSDACQVVDNSCPLNANASNTGNICSSGYFLEKSEETVLQCVHCSTLSEELGYYNKYGFNYRYSVNATLLNGANACYASVNGLLACDYSNWNILDSDYLPTGEAVNVCPENATCVDSAKLPTTAYAWYPSYVPVPTDYCKFDFTCNPGYAPNTSTTTNIAYGYKRARTGSGSTAVVMAKCTPDTFTVTLDDTLGNGGTGTIWQKYTFGWYSDADATTQVDSVTVPTLQHWTFLGYFTQESGGEKIIDETGKILADNTAFVQNTTLYAQWFHNVNQCELGYYFNLGVKTECQVPYYCTGNGEVFLEDTGCRTECPSGNLTPGNGTTLTGGANNVNQCFKTFTETDGSGKNLEHGTAQWLCQWQGDENQGEYSKCDTTVLTCDAGYFNPNGTAICSDVDSGWFSPNANLNREACPSIANWTVGSDGKRATNMDCFVECSSYLPTVEHATSVAVQNNNKRYFDGTKYALCEYAVVCETGYTPVNGTTPQCVPKVYNVMFDANGGSGNLDASVQCTFDSGICALPDNSGLKKPGYVVVAKWCTSPDGTGVCFDAGHTSAANISDDATDVKLYAVWTPGVFEITLDTNDADENAVQGPVYLKYATGWFADKQATIPLPKLVGPLPGKGGESYKFAGYKIGELFIIDAAGVLQTSDTVLKITTENTTANVVWTAESTKCNAGTYYPGFSSKCLPCEINHFCPGGTFKTDSGTIGGMAQCPNDGLSAGGALAKDLSVCFKENLPYVSDSQNATGSESCFYGTVAYSENCYDITVNKCAAGYWYDATQNALDCVAVGENYYSAKDELTRHQCPDNGNTQGKLTATQITDCVKRVDTYTSITGNARGSHVCVAGINGVYNQSCKGDTIQITWCAGGFYYDASETVTDCVQVGLNFFSAEGDMTKTKCPHDGVTEVLTADTPVGICKKSVVYPGIDIAENNVHGVGSQVCFYDQDSDGKLFGTKISDGYLLNCKSIVIHECNQGYYWAAKSDTVCSPVGLGYFGPIADVNNENMLTAAGRCPDAGKTKTTTSGDVSECFREQLVCTIVNGYGENTCNYSAEKSEYVADCTECIVTGCEGGFSLIGNQCIVCPADHVCKNGIQQTCAATTNNQYIKSDAGTTDAKDCFRECETAENAYKMKGRDYYGADDTCQIELCVAGYTMVNGQCEKCPSGYVCTPDSPQPWSCLELTNNQYDLSDVGADDVSDCYKKCEPYALKNGTAIPQTDIVFVPETCQYDGLSATGNPCEISGDICIETSCKYDFELIDNVCMPCNVPYAKSYKTNGNCLVAECEDGYYPDGHVCVMGTTDCAVPNAIKAKQTWDESRHAFGECIVIECDKGYHLSANACQSDTQVCELANGVGVRIWNHTTNTWGKCVATRCNPGFTNNPELTNENWESCGRCNNMYDENGEQAVSTFEHECKIAACMYQGQKYILQDGQCILICRTITDDDDDTGTQYWDDKNKKCVQKCNPGYLKW